MSKITGKELFEFMKKYDECPTCGQNYIIRNNKLRTTIFCKDNMIIRKCHDCKSLIKYCKE